jgi:hypothetical protein
LTAIEVSIEEKSMFARVGAVWRSGISGTNDLSSNPARALESATIKAALLWIVA